MPILDGFADEQVVELAAAGVEVAYDAGVRLFDEGRPADDWWVLLSGRIDLVRRIGHEEAMMATMEQAGQWAGGFRAWDEHGIYMGSAQVMEPSRVFRLPATELGRLGETWFPFAVHLLRGLIGTARRIETNARQREALVALGTLAAGLAHEINNPASAAVRSVGALQQSSDDVFASLQRLAGRGHHRRAVRRPRPPAALDRPVVGSDRRRARRAWRSRSATGSPTTRSTGTG